MQEFNSLNNNLIKKLNTKSNKQIKKMSFN